MPEPMRADDDDADSIMMEYLYVVRAFWTVGLAI